MDASREVIGLYPTEKIGGESILSICPASRLDIMITDDNADREKLAKFEEAGIRVVITKKKQ